MIPDAKGVKKTAKQCRERWYNVEKPKIEGHLPIIGKRELKLFELYSKSGFERKWAQIANMLGSTTDNCVKNHYYSVIRKELRYLWKKYNRIFPDPYSLPTKELTVEYIDKLLAEYDIGIDCLKNVTIKTLIKRNCDICKKDKKSPRLPKLGKKIKETVPENLPARIPSPPPNNKINENSYKKTIPSFQHCMHNIQNIPILNLKNLQEGGNTERFTFPLMNNAQKKQNRIVTFSPVLFANQNPSLSSNTSNHPIMLSPLGEFPMNQVLIPNPLGNMHYMPSLLIDNSFVQYSNDFNSLKFL